MSDSAPLCHGEPALVGRTEQWMEDLLADPARCRGLLAEHGSPVNVHDFAALARNASELVDAARTHGVPLRVFVARKANKTLALVDAAVQAGHGLDVASLRELEQCLDRGVSASDIIVTAAVKSRRLFDVAASAGVVVSLDNGDELSDALSVAAARSADAVPVPVALRLAVSDPSVATSRFGLTASEWLRAVRDADTRALRIEGIHFHLNGYSAAERATALAEACHFADALREAGHPITFIDMGGGVPMSYLEDERAWADFWRRLDADEEGATTWKGDRFGLVDPAAARPSPTVYPFWQAVVRGPWLMSVLDARVGDDTVAQMLIERGLELRCEPGRAVLDGCGMTLSSVAFTKSDRDGRHLVGLHMNRTQMRSTSADVLIDPRWVAAGGGDRTAAGEAFLVGAYCIEDEAILRRRLSFPRGVSRDDVVAFVNTAGYLMHIVESASHQLPLAVNLVRDGDAWRVDDIDQPTLGAIA